MVQKVLLRLGLLAVLCGTILLASQTVMNVDLEPYTNAPSSTHYIGWTSLGGGVRTVGTLTNGNSTFKSGWFCVDVDQHYTDANKSAYVTTLDSVGSEWANTKLARGTARNYTSNSLTTQDRYQMAAYLTTFLDGNESLRSVIWSAVWTFTDVRELTPDIPSSKIDDIGSASSSGGSGTMGWWIAKARNDKADPNSAWGNMQWGRYALTSQYAGIASSRTWYQEGIVQIPEPGAYFLMGTAFLGVILVVRRRRRMSRQAQV